jgi:hypothetical protein
MGTFKAIRAKQQDWETLLQKFRHDAKLSTSAKVYVDQVINSYCKKESIEFVEWIQPHHKANIAFHLAFPHKRMTSRYTVTDSTAVCTHATKHFICLISEANDSHPLKGAELAVEELMLTKH